MPRTMCGINPRRRSGTSLPSPCPHEAMTRDRDTPHAPDFRSVGHCQVSCVVAGDPANLLIAQRRAGLEPVTTALVRQVEAQTGTIQRIFPPHSGERLTISMG